MSRYAGPVNRRSPPFARRRLAALLAVCWGFGPPAAATTIDPRWLASFEGFAAADRQAAPVQGGVVFVGSSSFRLWRNLETTFSDAGAQIVNRAFGGSRLADCERHLDRLVLPYEPRLVVVYAGDNDLAEGRTPQQVMDSFAGFVDGVRRALPQARIAYVSIKPSPARAALLPQVREANALISAYAQTLPGLSFIDVYSGMVDDSGRPRPELFLADRLHLNEAGYEVWRDAIGPHLREAGRSARPVTASLR